jgi:hypothetical protein
MTLDSHRDAVVGLLPEWTRGLGGTLRVFEARENAAHKCCHVGRSTPGLHSRIAAGIETLAARLPSGDS